MKKIYDSSKFWYVCNTEGIAVLNQVDEKTARDYAQTREGYLVYKDTDTRDPMKKFFAYVPSILDETMGKK